MAKTLATGRKPGSGRKPGKGKKLSEGRKPGSGRRPRSMGSANSSSSNLYSSVPQSSNNINQVLPDTLINQSQQNGNTVPQFRRFSVDININLTDRDIEASNVLRSLNNSTQPQTPISASTPARLPPLHSIPAPIHPNGFVGTTNSNNNTTAISHFQHQFHKPLSITLPSPHLHSMSTPIFKEHILSFDTTPNRSPTDDPNGSTHK